jgi:hypothetical protein
VTLEIIRSISWAALGLAAGCAFWVIWDETEHAQRMWIMYLVWPLVTLSGGPIAVWLYRKSRHYGNSTTPFPLAVASATCHCGAGCTLGDLVAESIAFSFPGVLVLFGLDKKHIRPPAQARPRKLSG